MEIKFQEYKTQKEKITLSIEQEKIIGIAGNDKEEFLKVITLNGSQVSNIIIDGEKLNKKNIEEYKRKISYIDDSIYENNFLDTPKKIMNYIIEAKQLVIRDIDKKIHDSIKIVGLDKTILDRKTTDLSSSEKRLLLFSISLLSNPEIIIIDEPFKSLDLKNKKKAQALIKRLKDQFKKTIIIISNSSNDLYNYTDDIFILKNGKVLLSGETKKVYIDNVDSLIKSKIEIPSAVKFTYLAKSKNVRLMYWKDIRDIIKDVYKHV